MQRSYFLGKKHIA